MKHKYFKPVSIYTHPVLSEFEFERMNGTERTYIAVCAFAFASFIGLLALLLIKSANAPQALPEARKRAVTKHHAASVTGKLELEDNNSVSYDRYWGKTR